MKLTLRQKALDAATAFNKEQAEIEARKAAEAKEKAFKQETEILLALLKVLDIAPSDVKFEWENADATAECAEYLKVVAIVEELRFTTEKQSFAGGSSNKLMIKTVFRGKATYDFLGISCKVWFGEIAITETPGNAFVVLGQAIMAGESRMNWLIGRRPANEPL